MTSFRYAVQTIGPSGSRMKLRIVKFECGALSFVKYKWTLRPRHLVDGNAKLLCVQCTHKALLFVGCSEKEKAVEWRWRSCFGPELIRFRYKGMEKMENELIFETGDSAMTIEYLRARLLSERSVSRSAKQRADELAERVIELEEQLKVVHLQRKKTEKATSDVLVILGSLGFSDESEGCDLSSDQELTHPQGCNGNCLDKSPDKSRSMEPPGNDRTMFSCRSLSWKSSRYSSQCERKFISAPSRRHSGFPSGDFSSLRHRLGKSCCQSKRKDFRSTADDSSENEAKSEPQRANDDFEISECNHDSQDEKLSAGNTASICITSPRRIINSELHFHEDEGDREMKRALERRAELICRHEAEENAQIEWEDKYREHNNSTPDSVEPCSQSDVTEERDELRRQPASDHATEDPNARVKDARINEVCRILSNEDDMQGQPSPQTTVGPQKFKNVDGVVSHTSHPENAVFMNVLKHTQDKPEHYLSSSSEEAAFNANYNEGETSKSAAKKSVSVSQEASKDLGSVLKALQLAKLSLQHKLRKLPLSEDGFKVKAEESQYFPARAQMPASCAALFRVPTDPQTEENLHESYLDSRSPSSLMHRYNESTSAVSLNNQLKLKPREGVTLSNASDGSSFDFANKTALSSLCNGDDCARSSSVLFETVFSNSDRYKLSPQFGTPRSSFTGSDGHGQSPLPDFHFGFLTNDFDGSSYPVANNQSSMYLGDLHANRSSPTSSDRREMSLQPKATTLSLINSDQIARNTYSSSSPTKLLVNTSSGSPQPFSSEPYYSCGPNISLSSNDRHASRPSHPSIPDFKPAVPTFLGFPYLPPSSGSARDLTPRKLGTYGTLN